MQIYEKLFKYTIFRKKKDIFYIFKSRFLMNHKSLKINIFILLTNLDNIKFRNLYISALFIFGVL